MVLFTTRLFRKIYHSKLASTYIDKIVNLFLKQQSAETQEITDDDIRGNTLLHVERMGIYDGLSSIYKVPKTGTTVDYHTASFPDKAFISGWWIFDHVNSNYLAGIGYVRDTSYFDRHARVYGNPCIVSGGPGLQLPWRPDSVPSLVTVANSDTHYRIPNHADFQVSGGGSRSWAFAIYPRSFGKVNSITQNCIELENREIDPDIQYIDLGNEASLWSQSLTKFTVSLWVRFNSLDGDSDEYIFSHGRGTNQSFRLTLERTAGTDTLQFLIKDSGGVNKEAISDNAMEEDRWYFVVCVYDNSLGSDNMKLYIDSVLQTDKHNFTSAINLSTTLLIGDTDAQQSPDIKVKDFRFWGPATALTAQNVLDLFVGNDAAVSEGNYTLVMDAGEGSSITSSGSSGSGLTALLVNGAHWNVSESFTHIIAKNQIYVSKRDDSSNKYTIWVETDGVLCVEILQGGSSFKKKMSSPMLLNTWNWIVVTWDQVADVIKIYRNASDISATSSIAGQLNENQGTAGNDLYFLSSNRHANLADCGLYLFGMEVDWMSSSEVTALFNNKISIDSTLTASQVAVTEFAMVE
ncbi:MAG TPA: LamG domain-containing protein [Nitrososphaeraceae archaeon]|nr:LamG domain-containing protein [Nitrososphaeraceae archaeon]